MCNGKPFLETVLLDVSLEEDDPTVDEDADADADDEDDEDADDEEDDDDAVVPDDTERGVFSLGVFNLGDNKRTFST